MDTYSMLLLVGGILIGAGLMIAFFTLVFLLWHGFGHDHETFDKK